MKRPLASFTLAVALALIVGGVLATPSHAVPRAFYGITSQTKLEPRDFKRMGKARVGTLRYEVSWNDIDRFPLNEENILAPREYAWWIFDPIVYLAAKHRIRILPMIYGTPHWVATLQGCPAGCHKLGPATPVAFTAFGLFMRAAVERYGPHGTFWAEHPKLPYLPIRTWQIWNEMNSSDFWKPWPDAVNYSNLLVAGGEAVHAVDPGATVLPGGMIGEPAADGKKTVSGWNFLRYLYAQPRVREAFDGVAIHPYGASVESIKGTVWHWREIMRRAGAETDPLWVTEIGWASAGAEHPLNRGPRGQAQRLRQAFRWFTRSRRALRLRGVTWYAWRDSDPRLADPCTWCARSGLLRWQGRRPKPAYKAFTSFTGGR